MLRIIAGLGLAMASLGLFTNPSAAQAQPGGAPLAAQGCIGCHGQAGAGQDAVPPIAGRPAAETEAVMRAFRANERPATIMGRIARGYTDAEIAAVAAYFAAPPR